MQIGKLDRTKLRPASFKIVDKKNNITLVVRLNRWDNEEKYKEETTSPNQMVALLPLYEYNRIQKHVEHLTGGRKSGQKDDTGRKYVKYLSPKQSDEAITALIEGLLSYLPLKTK